MEDYPELRFPCPQGHMNKQYTIQLRGPNGSGQGELGFVFDCATCGVHWEQLLTNAELIRLNSGDANGEDLIRFEEAPLVAAKATGTWKLTAQDMRFLKAAKVAVDNDA